MINLNHTDLNIALQHIAPFYRRMLHMHYCLKMSYEEISAILNLSVMETKQLMYRARKECLQTLQKQEKKSVSSSK